MQLVMWFAGLRGAISYALSVHVGQYYGENEEELKRTLVTTTLVTVLFTIVALGGLTIPVVKYLRRHSSISQERSMESDDEPNLRTMMSKTIQFDELLNEDENYMNQRKHITDDDDIDNYEIHFANPNTMKGLEKFNEFYVKPLLVRKTSLKPRDEHEMTEHDRKPLLSSSSNGKQALLLSNDDDDEDEEDDLLVVNQLRQENFPLKTINKNSKDKKQTNSAFHDT
ncbi:unnamed protein product [Adineta ricciae]|uniref:Cation/H+ exchanger domain-containing protein n=1 Tax=Adineta ricciae TaxID=249248 RepID=A0A813YH86_ADIRI|nr:unnamed protein product [Adineta ricciae]